MIRIKRSLQNKSLRQDTIGGGFCFTTRWLLVLQGRPCTLWIVRSTPREARLLRKIAQGLAVRLDLFKFIRIKRIVRHDEIICCSNTPIAFGAYARREFFLCRRGRNVRLLFCHAFGVCFGVGEHGVPFLREFGGIGIDVVGHIVLRDDIGIIRCPVDNLSVCFSIMQPSGQTPHCLRLC